MDTCLWSQPSAGLIYPAHPATAGRGQGQSDEKLRPSCTTASSSSAWDLSLRAVTLSLSRRSLGVWPDASPAAFAAEPAAAPAQTKATKHTAPRAFWRQEKVACPRPLGRPRPKPSSKRFQQSRYPQAQKAVCLSPAVQVVRGQILGLLVELPWSRGSLNKSQQRTAKTFILLVRAPCSLLRAAPRGSCSFPALLSSGERGRRSVEREANAAS